jgi:hypothetical protein
MLFLMGLAVGAALMLLAQRRAGAIRLRTEKSSVDHWSTTWDGWAQMPKPVRLGGRRSWRRR